MSVCSYSRLTSHHCFMSSCVHERTSVETLDTGNRNLVEAQIISAGHTVEDSGNFYRGWWLFSREITGENREGAHGLRGEKREDSGIESRRRNKTRSLGEGEVFGIEVRFLPGIDYGNRACSCFFESRKIPRVHVDSADHEVEPIRQSVEYRRRGLTRVSWIRREMASRCHSCS